MKNRPTELVLGTMTFGDTVDLPTADRIVRLAIDAGVRQIDTANAYVAGRTEEMLSELLVGLPDDVAVATKVGMPHLDAGDHPPLSPLAVRACVEASLRRLGRDRVDLLYLHQPDRLTPIQDTLAEVAALVGEGKVGGLGLSNFSAWMTADVERAAAETGAPAPRIAQQLLNLVARRLEAEYLEMSMSHDLDLMVYNPLAGGLLSGRHEWTQRPDSGRFGDSRLAQMYTDRYWSQELFAAIADLTGIAENAGLGLRELALRWLVGHPGVTHLLLGASQPEHLQSNIEVIRSGPLPPDVRDECDRVGALLAGPMPAYHR